MTDQSVLFGSGGTLVGTLSEGCGAARAGVVFLNAGLIHRVGPGRMYVDFGRALAKQGITSLRFDHSGIGDSPRSSEAVFGLELQVAEATQAVDYLRARGVDRVVVFGLCSGAYVARKLAAMGAVEGVILVNPQDLAPGTDLAKRGWMKRYLGKSVFSPKSWMNLLTGKTNYRRLAKVVTGEPGGKADAEPSIPDEVRESVDEVRTQLVAFAAGGGEVEFVLSERDPSVDELSVFLGFNIRRPPADLNLGISIVQDADHLFMAPSDKSVLLEKIRSLGCLRID